MRKLLGTGSSVEVSWVTSVIQDGLAPVPWVMTSLGPHGPILIFSKASLVAFTVSGRGWTDLALTTLPSDVATMCSPEENWIPIHSIKPPFGHHPPCTAPDNRCKSSRVWLPLNELPCGDVPLSNLGPVQEITSMFKEPCE